MLPNFVLQNKGEYEYFLDKNNLKTFHELINFIKKIPYGRTTSRGNLKELFENNRGTCSTKHAFLLQICELNNFLEVELIVGIFLMDASYAPKLRDILDKYKLIQIPEAHCYLRFNGKRYDFTSESSGNFESKLIREQRCEWQQIVDWKPMIHKNFIASWKKRNNISLSEEELWEIREECIGKLSISNL